MKRPVFSAIFARFLAAALPSWSRHSPWPKSVHILTDVLSATFFENLQMQLFNAPGRLVQSFLAGKWPSPVYQFGTWTLVVVSGLAAGGIVRQVVGLAL